MGTRWDRYMMGIARVIDYGQRPRLFLVSINVKYRTDYMSVKTVNMTLKCISIPIPVSQYNEHDGWYLITIHAQPK